MLGLSLFYIAAAVALAATVMAMSRTNAVHALIYLIVSLLAVAVVFFLLGAPFAAALEVVIYAGAIMVLFVFVIMMLNLGDRGEQQEKQLLQPKIWLGPVFLALLLLAELIYIMAATEVQLDVEIISAKQVGISLYGPYVLAVEIASMLLLAGLVGAYHLGRQHLRRDQEPTATPKQIEEPR